MTNSSSSAVPTLSVAIIVRDDGKPLAATLKSIAGLANEIVVLDTGSSDDTCFVAQQAGVKLLQTQWMNDFSAARNQCYQHATGDWVLWLDAGETLSASDAHALQQFVASEADNSHAYMMLVTTPAGEKGEAGEQIGRIRLVPRLPEIRFTGRVRESLNACLQDLAITVEGLPMRIARGQREHNPVLKHRRARRDLVLAEQETKESGADPRLLLTLGEALRNLGQPQQAVEMFRHAVHRATGGSDEMLEAYYGVLTTMTDGSAEILDQQVNICLEALEIYPLDAQLLCAMGGFLVQQGNLELGVRSFETAIEHGQVHPSVYHLSDIPSIAAICAATALTSRQEPTKAEAILQQAIVHNPHNEVLKTRLSELKAAG